ncbi:hypothetical protein NZ698_13270 [Chryseobacterium sp. PBS4-4]|uniref:Uncharacterized protein n=1 Tax=Chryseobacterium edaphi TaxID=2976532 RepID=A0ABT2W878_9FLAO|nr:hypothetical protein [Chryseobacterium edaphi]MCU7618173.1 hypothetical protein [Chryseobacterium edaphi]
MTYILELENKDDLPKVKKLLEQIKGARVFESDEDEIPNEIYEALDRYADSIKEEDCISSEEFFANARKKVCELYSRK